MHNIKIKRFDEIIVSALIGTWFIWFVGQPTPAGHGCIALG